MRLDSTLSPEYSRSLGRGVIVIGLIFAVSVLVADGGLTALITIIAVLGYMAGVVVMAIRRPQAPVPTDVRFLREGFLFLWLATQVCARAWAWRGQLLP